MGEGEPDADDNIPHPPAKLPRLWTCLPLAYLVDSTSKGNPGPLSPAERHTLLPHLCQVSSRKDLMGQAQHFLPHFLSLCIDMSQGA